MRRRHVFVLKAVYGYSHEEIADLLGISSGTARAPLSPGAPDTDGACWVRRSSMSDKQDPRAEQLDERVAGMAREVMPERDLWPEISSRLEPRDRAGVGPADRVAASRLGLDRGSGRRRLPVRGMVSVGIDVHAAWTTDAALAGSGPSCWRKSSRRLDHLPASTRAVVETDLAGFELAWLGIEEASENGARQPLAERTADVRTGSGPIGSGSAGSTDERSGGSGGNMKPMNGKFGTMLAAALLAGHAHGQTADPCRHR